MTATELLWLVFEWLPRVFVLDVLVFHLVADQPLAARRWWRRSHPRLAARSTAL